MSNFAELIIVVDTDEAAKQRVIGIIETVFQGKDAAILHFPSVETLLAAELPVATGLTVIMDANTPDLHGNLAARQVWQWNSRARIIFWSYAHRNAYLSEIRKLTPGSTNFAYVLKSDDNETVAFAISSVCFHNNTYIAPACRDGQRRHSDGSLSRSDYETLLDVVFGLTDKAISQRRSISVRGVQNRLGSLFQRLGCDPNSQPLTTEGSEFFNARTRLVYLALMNGHISPDDIEFHRPHFEQWVCATTGRKQPAMPPQKRRSGFDPLLSPLQQLHAKTLQHSG